MCRHVGVYLLLGGRGRRLDHPWTLRLLLAGLLNHDNILVFRFAIVAQAVFLANLLLGCRVYVIVTSHFKFLARSGERGARDGGESVWGVPLVACRIH